MPPDDSCHSYTLFGTFKTTTVFQLKSNAFEELEVAVFPGFVRQERTLAACNIEKGDRAAQVTPSAIVIVDMITGAEIERWPANKTDTQHITCAAVNPTQVVIALRGGKLMLFSTSSGALKLIR